MFDTSKKSLIPAKAIVMLAKNGAKNNLKPDIMYTDRTDAGERLAEMLMPYANTNSVVLAIPRGGVPVACVVSEKLRLPLDLMMVKKIGHPQNPEFAIGAAGIKDYYVDPTADVDERYILKTVREIGIKLESARSHFMKSQPALPLDGKNVILVDDGVATGHTMLAAVKIARASHPRKIIIAVPVASRSSIALLRNEADEVVVPLVPAFFDAVGPFYHDFSQISDEKVKEWLDRFPSAL